MLKNMIGATVLAAGISAVLPVSVHADHAQYNTFMRIELLDGRCALLKVENDLRLDIADGSMLAVSYNHSATVFDNYEVYDDASGQMTCNFTDVRKFSYVNIPITGTEDITSDVPVLSFKDNVLSIETGSGGKCIVYSIDGTVDDIIAFEGKVNIDLSRYGKGLHLIKVNENAPFKIIVR